MKFSEILFIMANVRWVNDLLNFYEIFVMNIFCTVNFCLSSDFLIIIVRNELEFLLNLEFRWLKTHENLCKLLNQTIKILNSN